MYMNMHEHDIDMGIDIDIIDGCWTSNIRKKYNPISDISEVLISFIPDIGLSINLQMVFKHSINYFPNSLYCSVSC
jgi:hypothetical protein